jgi:hypothetical protein
MQAQKKLERNAKLAAKEAERATKKALREAKQQQAEAARAAAAAAAAWKPYGDAHKALLDVVEEKQPLGSGASTAWAEVADELTTTMAETHGKTCAYTGDSCYTKFFALVNKPHPTGNDDEHLIPRAKKIEQLILKKSGARSPVNDGVGALENTGIPGGAQPSAAKNSGRKIKAADAATDEKKKKARFSKDDLPVSPTHALRRASRHARCSPAPTFLSYPPEARAHRRQGGVHVWRIDQGQRARGGGRRAARLLGDVRREREVRRQDRRAQQRRERARGRREDRVALVEAQVDGQRHLQDGRVQARGHARRAVHHGAPVRLRRRVHGEQGRRRGE